MTSGQKKKTPKPDKTPVVSPASIEWGVPDWRDKDAYGDVESWTIARWRWEFCRRDPELRECFAVEARRLAAAPVEEQGFNEFVSKLEYVNLQRLHQDKFRYYSIHNPRMSLEPKKSDHKNLLLKTLPLFYQKNIREIFLENELSFIDRTGQALGHLLNATPVAIDSGQVAVIFYLERPLKRQIEAAENTLKEAYKAAKLQPSPRDRLLNNRLALLRTLDAKAANAGWREIAAIHGVGNTPETVRDKHQQAQAMWRNLRF